MIKVDRSTVPAPEALAISHKQELSRIVALLGDPSGSISANSDILSASPKIRKIVRMSLTELFGGKCAFCERPAAAIERFRPRWRASRLDGRIDSEHYWWLASDWNNLYLCCHECNSLKRNQFPIDGPPATPLTFGEALAAEKPLLLDPCEDDPALHMRFLADGRVEPITLRGEVTVKIFALNNPGLLQTRGVVADSARHRCELEWLLKEYDDKEEFARTVLIHFHEGSAHRAVVRSVIEHFFDAHSEIHASRSLPSPVSEQAAGSRPEDVNAISSAVWLHHIEIRNFKSVTHFDQGFPQPAEDKAEVGEPWLMFLGENGAGKTSILQAVALALMPDEERDKLGSPARWQSKDSDAGFVRLTFTDGSKRKLSFNEGDKSFSVEGTAPPMPVLAYGATRLLPDRTKVDERAPTSISVRNLFDPTFPLIDAERWLCNETAISDGNFDLLVADLSRLLPAGAHTPIERTKTRLNSRVRDKVIPLRELSSGYKSVLALAMDIMLHLTNSSFDMESAQGLVMIDELELHLHPRWKICIVEQLRSLFPRVRFISCTHDPLCVHGLRSGELHIIGHDPATEDLIVEQFDVPPGTRADEILTGPWFGLQSTMDAGTKELMADHSALLQLDKRTEEQERRLASLYHDLRLRLGDFGNTPDTRAALASAARHAPDFSRDFATDAQVSQGISGLFTTILHRGGALDREDDRA